MAAAQATLATRMANAPVTQRVAIRIRIEEDTEGKTPKDILDAIKPTINRAYAVKLLYSGNFKILIKD